MNVGPGTRLGSFEILDSLGSGGMGEVYRAKDLKLGRLVALKVLRPELASQPDRLSRFEQEARAASALSHPAIVHIYDIGTEGEVPYLAMELVPGCTLRKLLGKGPLAFERLRKIALQIAEGLARAHEAGIVHRDLKPENLMVDDDGRARILDFGLAKLAAQGLEGGPLSQLTTLGAQGTRPGILLGTVEYMSPEQAASRSVDFRSDQFSLGSILYEMATGQMAFRRETAPQTMAAILERDPAPLPGHLPEAFRTLVDRLLRKDPEERFPDTRQVARILEGMAGRPTGTIPPLPPLPTRPLPSPFDTVGTFLTRYRVQKDGSVRTVTERRLRRRIRKGTYTGFEKALKEGETEWRPLYETEVFRQEVPFDGDPKRAAQWRQLRGFGGHFLGFAIACTVLLTTAGTIPFGFGIWAIFLVLHGVRTLPALWGLLEDPQSGGLQGALSRLRRPRAVPNKARPEKKAAPQHVSPSFLEEVERVRELLARSEDPEHQKLEKEIDRIVTSVGEIGARMSDLKEQTAPRVLEKLAESEDQTRRRLERADRPADRDLYQRQLDLLATRRRSVDDARRLLDQLAARRELAEQQIQQLRLDLSRAEALRAEPPELSSRLEEIRLEVEATEAVADDLAPDARWALEQALPEAPESEASPEPFAGGLGERGRQPIE